MSSSEQAHPQLLGQPHSLIFSGLFDAPNDDLSLGFPTPTSRSRNQCNPWHGALRALLQVVVTFIKCCWTHLGRRKTS